MSDERTHEDAFNLLCGRLIGEGIHRKVFRCRIRDDLVVKVECDENWRYFGNVHEMKFWNDHEHQPHIVKWLAPCEYLSPDGRIMLQKRTIPLRDGDEIPDKLPSFLTDIKRENFGLIDGKIVCHDYAMTIPAPSMRLKKVEWGRT